MGRRRGRQVSRKSTSCCLTPDTAPPHQQSNYQLRLGLNQGPYGTETLFDHYVSPMSIIAHPLLLQSHGSLHAASQSWSVSPSALTPHRVSSAHTLTPSLAAAPRAPHRRARAPHAGRAQERRNAQRPSDRVRHVDEPDPERGGADKSRRRQVLPVAGGVCPGKQRAIHGSCTRD